MVIMQSLVQIILESLPISSSGHQELLQKIVHWPQLTTAYEYCLHGPTILILLIYFRATWVPLLLHCWRFRQTVCNMLLFGCAADLVTAPLYGCMKLIAPYFPLWLGFSITALMLLSLYGVSYQRERITFRTALILGCIQGIAGLPGISRLASTYVAAVWLGLPAYKSFSFSCMIQFPLICAGFLYGTYKTFLLADYALLLQPFFLLSIGAGTVLAYLLLWWVNVCMEEQALWKFGLYMILPCIIASLV